MRILYIFTINLFCLWLCQPSWGAEKKANSSRTRVVRIYFLRQNKAKTREFLKPVFRRVNAKVPRRDVLMALLKGATAKERKLGFWNLDSDGLQIRRLSIRGSTAFVDFVSDRNQWWVGDVTPSHFRDAVKKSLLQFPAGKKVEVSVDRDKGFYVPT